MTLPNKLTMFRILVIPIMVGICYIPTIRDYIFLEVPLLYLIELLLFAAASVTDFLDGYIARKHNLITTFGKFADPLADKMLVFTAMAIFLADGLLPMWVFVIILVREFMVSGIRMVTADKKVVIAASKLGKYKTATTMAALMVMFMSGIHQSVFIIGQVLIYLACILTVISGIDYFVKHRKYILESI